MFKGKILFSNYKYLNQLFKISDCSYKNKSGNLDFAKKGINNDLYVVATLLPNNKVIKYKYEAIDELHSWLIYGYDDNEELHIARYPRYLGINGFYKNMKFKNSYEKYIDSIPDEKLLHFYNNLMDNHIFSKIQKEIDIYDLQIKKQLKKHITINPLKPNKGYMSVAFLLFHYDIQYAFR